MVQIAYADAAQLADDILNANLSIDDALVNVANLTNSIIAICRKSSIPAAKSQAAIQEVTDGMTKLVSARKDFVAAHKHIVVVHKRSNLQEVDFGCAGDGPIRNPKGLHVVNS
jgi:hypothetical protein